MAPVAGVLRLALSCVAGGGLRRRRAIRSSSTKAWSRSRTRRRATGATSVITVNDHFRGGVPCSRPGGRLNAPLSQFQTGFGQQFDRGRQSVFKVEVTATDPDGKPVSTRRGDRKRVAETPTRD